MKVAAVHLDTTLAESKKNLKKAEIYIKEAAHQGAILVVLPEFFSTGFAYTPKLITEVLTSESPLSWLKRCSKTYNVIVGGSYLAFDGKDIHNTFSLVFPTGQIYSHSKDIPTMLENCCYTYGDQTNVFETPIGRVGIALCWEQIRYATVKRMMNKVDLIVAGSCWWGFSDADPMELIKMERIHHMMAVNAPIQLAKLLHVPVIHASHHATFTGINIREKCPETRTIYGATQIIDQEGQVLGRRRYEEAGGLVIKDIICSKQQVLCEIPEYTPYWIPKMPPAFLKLWETLNSTCHSYYETNTKNMWEHEL